MHASEEPRWPYCELLFDETGFKTVFFYQMFEEINVKFYMNDGVREIRGNNGKVALILFFALVCLFLYEPVLKKNCQF